MDGNGLLWTSVDDGLWTEVDISGEWTWTEVDLNEQWSFRHVSSTGFQPAKLYHAYSHASLCRRRLTMLNLRLQPGDRRTPKLVPCKGTTEDRSIT